jgi:quercetin dioxygenase-like cupin family protein
MEHFDNIPAKELAPGFMAKLIHGAHTTLSIVTIKKGSVLPEHRHVHEQITYIVEGRLDMTIGGKPYSLTAGTVHVIPSNTPHNAVAITDCTVIDAFSPARDDYR